MAQEYVVLLHGDERVWAEADEAARAAAYAAHGRFMELCAERGHTVTGGAELAPAATSLLVRVTGAEGSPVVTDGPFLETVEQLGGYYQIATDDVRDLARLAAELLLGPEDGTVEIRPVVTGGEADATAAEVAARATADA
ncbi:YciI family protein [Cellulomonas sp. NS3]|uniref:YciI family protein n=1 Tax=Cellulomonas sp. NS3 TaxID=2973977 RepID=UPI002163C389|nr:YciI family protein [Cellulomonas sp. NS3]